ncbi:DUF4931 domain-containing protein [Patescibacteria group bacterium]|nr:DUF4931 domain-containing protein [Patescibacteria group bacterium]
MKKVKSESPSEFRLDIVSGDWVIIATGRACRPETFAKNTRIKEAVLPANCPFCRSNILEKSILTLNKPDGSWFISSIPNDFPALCPKGGLSRKEEGPYEIMNGYGEHEVIITADHERQMAQFSQEEMELVVELYQKRYLDLIKKENIKYISIFHNHGQEAGASVAHPHSQLIAIPVLDPNLRSSLDGAEAYYRQHKKCVYCEMIAWDIKDGRRIIYQNEKFVVLSPFAPQVSFEVRVYPKKHQAHFGEMAPDEKALFADAFLKGLSSVYQKLKDPAYNFYIHTAPVGKEYGEYHWHLNILPKTAIMAGFELGAGIEISVIEPEKAAEFLRSE